MRFAVTAFALLAWAPSARAQGVDAMGASIEESVLRSVAECPEGRLIVRARSNLPDVPSAPALLRAVVEPTLVALRAEGRFEAVHSALFEGEGAEAAERARRLGYRTLVDIMVEREGSGLVTQLSVFRTSEAEPIATRRLAHRLDVSLRRHLGFPPPVSESTVRARAGRMPSRDYLGLAVHDFDGDGRGEIVAVRADRVEVVRVSDGRVGLRVEVVGHAPWPEVSRAASIRRRPIAVVQSHGDGVVARLSDFAAPFRVELSGGAVVTQIATGPCAANEYPLEGRCGRLVDGRDFFDDAVSNGAAEIDVGPHFYVLRELRYETREGSIADFRAFVSPTGRLTVSVERTIPSDDGGDAEVREHARSAPGYGTALAMTDLDLDGSAEILASGATPPGRADHLRLVRAFDRGRLRAFWESDALEGSVWVACAGDTDGDGLSELLAIEETPRGRARLWIVH